MNKLLLAVDPGRDKSGLAVVDEELKVYFKGIIPAGEIDSYLTDLFHKYDIDRVVLGNGTTSGLMEEKLSKFLNDNIPICLIDESGTTMEAERRYRSEKNRGWKKLFSFISWKPAQPLDDYVAVILAEKYLAD